MDQLQTICSYKGCSHNVIGRLSIVNEKVKCPFCQTTLYCSISCVEMDWIVHRTVCKGKRSGETLTSTSKSGKKRAEQECYQKYVHFKRDYEVLQNRNELGQGSFGIVMLVRDRQTNQQFAMKIVKQFVIYYISNTEDYCSIDNLKREIKIQRKLDHPHITKLYSYFEDKENVYLILEYAEKGSLFHNLKKKKRFNENEGFVYFFQTCLGIDYLHKRNIIHRDLKPENLLLDKNGNVKICDFGWSTDADQKSKNLFCGTIEYMPPEMIKNQPHNFKLDIWGLGILLYELVHGKTPFNGKNDQEKCQAILNYTNIRFDSSLSDDIVNLITSILKPNPKDRPTIRQIFQHRWMMMKQQQHKINLQDYLWEDTTFEKTTSLQNTERKISVQHQQKPQSLEIIKSEPLKHLVQTERSHSNTTKTLSKYSSNRQVTEQSTNRTESQIKKQPHVHKSQEEIEWEATQRRNQELERMIPSKPRPRQQQQPEQQGFFTRLFIQLGCLSRDREGR